MLANNPMGTRRRRRFYHRVGVVPIPGERFRGDFNEPDFFKYEPEPLPIEVPNEEPEEAENSFSYKIQRRKRRVNVSMVNVGSFLHRLLGIIDSVIAMVETEKRVNAKKRSAKQEADEKTNQASDQASAQLDKGVKEFVFSKPKPKMG